MIQRRFYLAVVIRVVLIVVAALVLAYNIFQHEKLFTVLGAGVAMVLLAVDLVRITNRFNRNMASFFEALKHEDHAFGLKKVNVPGFPVLSGYMDEISRKLSRVYADRAVQARFLNSIVDHISVGLMATGKDGRVVFFNQAAQQLLNLHRITHTDALRQHLPEFGNMLMNMKAGDQKMVRIQTPAGLRHLSLRSGFFTSREEQMHLYSFQDVGHEVEEAELDTWKKLIRVLTHEINNSISPIYSLSDSIRKKMLSMTGMNKMAEGLHIIQERSRGLLDFVEKFRSLTPRGSLQRESFAVAELFYRVRILMQDYHPVKSLGSESTGSESTGSESTGRGPRSGQSPPPSISTSVYPDSLHLYADKKLLEQVLINLVKNAMEAEIYAQQSHSAEKRGTIHLKAFQEGAQKVIEVADDGPGMSSEQTKNIFIPFYTTKQGGSGVGLSLSRQIMRMHGGNISIRSKEGEGTTFKLTF